MMIEKFRAPIVTVLGHVDHGKTTLLDTIRKTSIAKKEAGGITQGIGASVITTKEKKKITFIDTPGHAAFSKMRSRGARVADIAVLVVAADDGVKPQTKEALKHILEAKIPYIVAVSKIDLPSASPETVRGQLEKEGVLFEGRGGDVPFVTISSKTGKGIDGLLEMINLVAEVNEIKADPKGDLEAVVIETSKDRRGPLVSVIVRNGTLRVGDKILAEDEVCKVRGLFDDNEKSVNQVLPGEPALILGFDELPPVGAQVSFFKDKDLNYKKSTKTVVIPEIKKGQIPLVIKTKTKGSLEAILSNLPKEIVVVSSGIGEVNKSDIFSAKPANAYLFAFETKVPKIVAKLAETEGVPIETFDIIYKLFERLDELIKESQEQILGKAEIIATFPFNKKRVAGCKVISGKIGKTNKLILMRGKEKIGEVKPVSMKKQKQAIQEAKEGEEFGLIFEPQLDFEIGDMLVSVAHG
jgi:translation initiation factor IF-2